MPRKCCDTQNISFVATIIPPKVSNEEGMTDDKAVIGAVLAGDRDAFRQLVVKYQRLVSHVVFRMVRGEEDREDVSQEVFLRAFRSLHSFRSESKFSTWIARIAHNTCINHLERGSRLPTVDEPLGDGSSIASVQSNPEKKATDADIAARLSDEIEKLPSAFRIVVTLYHIEEYKYEEIADIMKQPIGTVKSHLFRARKLLKERLLVKYREEDIRP